MSVVAPSVRGMIIDCGTCTVRGDACTDCVVTFLTIPVLSSVPEAGAPPGASHIAPPGASRAAAGRHLTEQPTGASGSGVPVRAGGVPVRAGGVAAAQGAWGASGEVDLDEAERRAIDVLARSGLVPPLRLERAV